MQVHLLLNLEKPDLPLRFYGLQVPNAVGWAFKIFIAILLGNYGYSIVMWNPVGVYNLRTIGPEALNKLGVEHFYFYYRPDCAMSY